MSSSRYEERFYRRFVTASDLNAYTLVVKETDLHIMTRGVWLKEAREIVIRLRHQVELAIEDTPEFLHSLKPIDVKDTAPPIVHVMAEAARLADVGPMAAVAGAISQMLGEALAAYSDETVIENGGDIYARSFHPLTVGIYAGKSPLSGRVGIRIKAETMPAGLCTSSGTVGHSLSFGQADAVAILAANAALADAAATAVGNVVCRAEDLQKGLDRAREISGVEGVLIIFGGNLGAWGEVELVETRGLQ
ncbi:MAG: UPF0280 family protein [Deltaproteobacteria bacterium]|nr:UPF0280 family protein [Deltaproteobacteria bacterium]MBW2307846.1 UPF0280 family protein [Deltaproteobacteria bacterium]